MNYLKSVKYNLPNTDPNLQKRFLNFLSAVGQTSEHKITLETTYHGFLPNTIFEFTDIEIPTVIFELDEGEYKVEIKNSTQITKQSPHIYAPIEIEEFDNRISDFKLLGIDHTGFNLPFFEGVHPEVIKLRGLLKEKCLYHQFPKSLANEPWDFILPGTKEEIANQQATNYQLTRKPKVEIVSFSKSSTPLIQIDIQLDGRYEAMLKLFPEAINDSDIRNLWVYIKNNFGMDICFVLNESQRKDWSSYFEGTRIK